MNQKSHYPAVAAVLAALVLAYMLFMPAERDAATKGAAGFQASHAEAEPRVLSYTELLKEAEQGKLAQVLVDGRTGYVSGVDGSGAVVVLPNDIKVIDTLVEKGVDVRLRPENGGGVFGLMLVSWLPILLMLGLGWLMFRNMSGKSGNMGFGRSKAKLHTPAPGQAVTFADVAGIEEARDDLDELVQFLRDPQRFQRLGGKIPKGMLLCGPPGTGKTLVARAVAGEANVPFYSISGSDFVEMFVGVGAARVRDMFAQARKTAPCILFIDEIDAMGRHRGAGLGGGNDEREQTLNQLLVEMDGFGTESGVIVVAATNRPDVLDPALLRPGRFDRQIMVPTPDLAGREKILSVHMRKLTLAPDVEARTVARGTPGFSGAELANLCNEAALLAARRGLAAIGAAEFDAARDKLLMGAERRSLAMTHADRRLTAYHEAGHALCALELPASDPIHKVTIVPRGRALGMVSRLPEGDRVSMSRERLEADLTVAMGGRVAEEIVGGDAKVTTGASGDIKAATEMARRMVTEWGMSDKVGPVLLADGNDEPFLGRSLGKRRDISERTAQMVDDEVRRIVTDGMTRARAILEGNGAALHALAAALLDRETLTGDEAKAIAEDARGRACAAE